MADLLYGGPRHKLSDAGIREIPLAPEVVAAIRRQLPPGTDPEDLVFTGPGGGVVARGTRTVLSRHNFRRTYHGAIANVQASWVKIGGEGVRQLLQAGVNDLGGTLIDENISRAAGAAHGQAMEPDDFAELVAPLGRRLTQRTTLYRTATRETEHI